MPIRGHSGVQGSAECGADPEKLPGTVGLEPEHIAQGWHTDRAAHPHAAELGSGVIGKPAREARHPLEGGIVEHHRHAIAGEADVEFHGLRAELLGPEERGHGVLRLLR